MFNHPIKRAIFGIIAVILIVVFSNWLMRSTSVGNRSLDLTGDKRHTLTEGTKSILSELDSPVIIRYYATRKSEAMPRRVKNYMRKVDDVLNRYKNLANGNIRLEIIDPQPDTDAEDSANLDGIAGQRINDENLYFGISVSCLDRQTSIPFLDPQNETMLEYQLSSAIANVTNFEKTTLGIITPLPMAGAPAQMPNQQPQKPWAIYRFLQQRYDVQTLGMKPKELDPEKIKVLLVAHPASIPKETEYLIDQYLLQGGIVVACLDPYALTAPQGNPMAGGVGAVPISSHLTSLLPAWGIGMDSTSAIADGKFASDFGENRRMYSHLSLNQEAITSKDEIVTRDFENLYFPVAGGFTINKKVRLKIDTLIETSEQAILVPARSATKPDPALFTRLTTADKKYGLVMRLKGDFPTGFPDGKPTKEKTDKGTSLKKSTKEGIVYLISDVDFLFDTACFGNSKQQGGYVAINNNAALLQNILDQCTGSKYLIGARSRAATMRPFTLVREMETQFAKELREDVEKARQKMNGTVIQLRQLQAQKSESKELVLSPEQEQKITELQEQQVKLRQELREKEKSLRARKDKLYAKITWLTVAVAPGFVAFLGFAVWLTRRRAMAVT